MIFQRQYQQKKRQMKAMKKLGLDLRLYPVVQDERRFLTVLAAILAIILSVLIIYIINGLFIPYITFLHIIQKTYLIACSTIIAFIANIILNIIFIPNYGILGAANATLISSLVQLFLLSYFSKELKIGKYFYFILGILFIFYFLNL